MKRMSRTGDNYGKSAVSYVLIGSNQRYPNNGRCMAVDFDDIAISTLGYIGPLSGSGAAVCGDGNCDPGETCPEDSCCSGVSYNNATQVCCSGTAYTGNCCSDLDCTSPETCQSYTCQPPLQCEQDLDGDGYGVGPSCLGPDCDDDNPSIHPRTTEICGDGVDQDCSGSDQACQSQGGVFIFQDSLPVGASIESGDPMAVSTNNPHQGTSSLEITGQGSWSNCRIINLNIDVSSLDWQSSYLELMASSPAALGYVAVNLWGDGTKAPEQVFSLAGSGGYEVIQIPLSGFSPTQAGFGNALTMFMIGSDWGSSTIHLDEVRIVSPGQAYHRADEDQSCTISQAELLAWINYWYSDSTAYPMWEMMQAVGFYYSGNAC